MAVKELRSFKPCPAYKESGVEWLGGIPAGWEVRRLKTLISDPITDGPHETPEFLLDGIPFLSVDGIQEGELVFDGCRYISDSAHREYRKKCAPRRDDILFGKAASTGKIARVKVDFEFGVWSPLALIRPELEEVWPSFLEYALKSAATQAQIDVLCTSSTQKNISMRDIPILVLCTPDLPEQRAIAAFLNRETARIDALAAKKERLIELLQEKRTALITRAVTKGLDPNVPMKDSGVEWLEEIPAHWEVKRIRNVVSRIEQGWSPDCENREADDDEWGVLKAGCVNRGVFVEVEHKALPANLDPVPDLEVHEGDLLMSRASGSRDLVGSVAVVRRCRPRLLLCDKVFRLHAAPDAGHRPFLAYSMNSQMARWQIEVVLSGGSGLANNIAQAVVKDLVVVTPGIDEQRAIATFLNQEAARIDALIANVREAIDRLKELRTALISAAVTGKIDVRGGVTETER